MASRIPAYKSIDSFIVQLPFLLGEVDIEDFSVFVWNDKLISAYGMLIIHDMVAQTWIILNEERQLVGIGNLKSLLQYVKDVINA